MNSRSYTHGKTTYRAYKRPVGRGYEVGVIWKGRPIFTSNFIKSTEAAKWWSTLNLQIRTFGKRYQIPGKQTPGWYSKFLADHLYSQYYGYVNKLLPKHFRFHTMEANKNVRKWRKVRKTTVERPRHYLRAA